MGKGGRKSRFKNMGKNIKFIDPCKKGKCNKVNFPSARDFIPSGGIIAIHKELWNFFGIHDSTRGL